MKNQFKVSKPFLSIVIMLCILLSLTGNIVVRAGTGELPLIDYIGVSHSPLVVGDTEEFSVNSNWSGEVQYRAFMSLANGTSYELTSGYTEAVNSDEIYVFPKSKQFQLGKHNLIVFVKRAGTTGIKVDKKYNQNYDSMYTANVNCVNRDDKNRVYATGDAKFDVEGMTVNFRGIEGLSGIKGPYQYRLHIYNPRTLQWIKRVNTYTENVSSYTFSQPGEYVVVAHINTPNSAIWKNYLKENKTVANQATPYGTYEAWKTFRVNITGSSTQPPVTEPNSVIDIAVRDAQLGSAIQIKLTAEGLLKYKDVISYQVLDELKVASSAIAKLGDYTTIFPKKVSGDRIFINLLDINQQVKATISMKL